MPLLAALTFARKYGWILAVAALAWWLHHQSVTIRTQHDTIAALQFDLADEKLSREHDVAGLTALASGLAAASAHNSSDQRILANAIPTAQPSSPGLIDLFSRLRAADAASGVHPAPARTGSTATR